MKIHLIAFGKLKVPGLRETTDYYLRNIRPWVQVTETELKPIAVPDKGARTRTVIQKAESALLNKKLEALLSARGKFFLLDESGKALTTMEWSNLARSWESSSVPEIAICLGSSLGWSTELKVRANGLLSLGPQTLSHELARPIIAEQLYRAWSVLRGHPYHNEG